MPEVFGVHHCSVWVLNTCSSDMLFWSSFPPNRKSDLLVLSAVRVWYARAFGACADVCSNSGHHTWSTMQSQRQVTQSKLAPC